MVNVAGIQIIGILVALFIIYESYLLHKKEKFTGRDFKIWGVIALILLFFSVAPIFIDYLLFILKVRRGLDALIIISILGAYALLFRVYIKVQEASRDITTLVRKVAIKFEEKKVK